MKIHDVTQRTPEWHQLRVGKLTGSRAKDMLATIQKGEAAARRDLRIQLVLERLTGRPQESDYVNADMQWGIDHEAEAVAAYEAMTGDLVKIVGFCEHDDLLVGTSPDGFVGDDGLLSVKCPRSANHLRYLRDGIEPKEYTAQNTHELWLTGRQWIDFMSYDPRMPDSLRVFMVRVTRHEAELTAYGAAVRAFLQEVETELLAVQTIAAPGRQLRAAIEATA